MQYSKKLSKHKSSTGIISLILGAVGCFALAVTFLLGTSNLEYIFKTSIFVGITGLFILICTGLFLFHRKTDNYHPEIIEEIPEFASDPEIDNKLLALDEANRFFGTSLNSSDMFKLVCSRINEIFPFAASALLVPTENRTGLKIVSAGGRNADAVSDIELDIKNGLAAKAAAEGLLEIGENLVSERNSIPEGFRSSAAIPLMQSGNVFAILQLYTEYKITADKRTTSILEAIGERISPIFRNSIAFESSLSNALTDSLTNLPNERAFFMILESQVAESQRYRDRPLTVLAIDIKDFASANLKFGHLSGDRILEFTAKLVKENLRKMDFLARSINDEYVVILPTAPEKTALDIVERIKAGFAKTPFKVAEGETIIVGLNFGWATFGKDGDTAHLLLQNAQLRKQQSKSEEPNKVLWFPKEYVN